MNEKEIRRRFEEICKHLNIPCENHVDLPTYERFCELFNKQYEKEHFDDEFHVLITKGVFIRGYLTCLALMH